MTHSDIGCQTKYDVCHVIEVQQAYNHHMIAVTLAPENNM